MRRLASNLAMRLALLLLAGGLRLWATSCRMYAGTLSHPWHRARFLERAAQIELALSSLRHRTP